MLPRLSHTLVVKAIGVAAAFAMLGISIEAEMDVAEMEAHVLRLRSAAERGSVREEIELGNAYLAGKGVPRDPAMAAQWFEKAAGSGDPIAENLIGYLYESGAGVPKDLDRAVHWFQLSAAAGLPLGKMNLAVCYVWGIGVPKNPKLGERLFREAASAGDSFAATYLGDMYYEGEGIPQDKEEGEKWYEQAAKRHNYLGEYRMGLLLSQTPGHAVDLKRALALLRNSAKQGFVASMHAAGLLMVNHPELKGSHEEALALLRRAAEAGLWKSSIVLAVLARDGKWVPQDDREAYFHFLVAVDEGSTDAQALLHNDLQIMRAKFNDAERSAIEAKARAWSNEHPSRLEYVFALRGEAGPAPMLAMTAPSDGGHTGALVPIESPQ